MSLFGKSKETDMHPKPTEQQVDKKQIEFQNIIVDTENVNQELKNISSVKNIPVNKLDFSLISFKSVFKTHTEDDWAEVDEDHINLFKDEDFLLNEELEVKQQYKIEIFHKDLNKEPKYPLEIILGGNKYLTKIVATIKKSLDIKYCSKLKKYIIDQINKKMIRQSMFISIFQSDMEKEVEKIISKIRVNGFLDEDSTFIVCHCLDPKKPIDDDLIFHYRKNMNKKDDQGRIDYAKRGYVQAVKRGDVLIEYIKAKEGKNGRNCRGELLKVSPPKQRYEINFTVSDNIERKEDDSKIVFVAKKDGYVNQEGDKYDIDDQMELNEISFKTTGSIEADINSNVKINIKEKDALKDAIGQGMSVETSEIQVEGNIGSGATVRAKRAEIGGQTHKTAKIYADDLSITVHRGYAEGKVVTVKRLEGGKINAQMVKVDQAIGGEIIAEKIFVDQLVSNVTLIASDHIEITKLKGSNNRLIIDPSVIHGFQEKIEELHKRLKKLESSMQITKKSIKEKKMIIEKNRESAELVKERILELKKNGQEPAKTLLKKIRDFQQMVNTHNALLQKYKKEQEEKSEIQKEIETIQASVLNAKIINHSPWTEYNEIKFVLLSPKVEVTHTTKTGEIAKEMTLEKLEEGEYNISRKSEFGSK
ncbi:MAG: DUF342 domain-containing protein [Epsilonproteobacteria bacterium]|nr:DUF342 domain-containing protein [Campylobacterota bacterium]